MNKYRIPFNKSEYRDGGNSPKRGYMTIKAETPEKALEIAWQRRIDTDITGVISKQGRRYFIGLIFEPEKVTKGVEIT